jgi:hypothetical protein
VPAWHSKTSFLLYFSSLNTHSIASMILQHANIWGVELQDELIGLRVCSSSWTEVEAPLHSFPTNDELKSEEIFTIYFVTTGCWNDVPI